ncbi:unnamed protein product [Discosporangium mesarthrocarpum]
MVTESLGGDKDSLARSNSGAKTARAVHEALERYEGALMAAEECEGGAEAFLSACKSVLTAAHEVQSLLTQVKHKQRDRGRQQQRELARLEKHTKTLDILRRTSSFPGTEEGGGQDAGGGGGKTAIKELSDATAALEEARSAVLSSSNEEWEGGSVSGVVNRAIEVAMEAESHYNEAREQALRAGRWMQKLQELETGLARVNKTAWAQPGGGLVAELCEPGLRAATEAVAAAQEATETHGWEWGGKLARLVVVAREKVEAVEREAREQAGQVRAAGVRRAALRRALATSSDSLMEAQAVLDAEALALPGTAETPQRPKTTGPGAGLGAGLESQGTAGSVDTVSHAVQACKVAEEAVLSAQALVNRPLTAHWVRSSAPTAAVAEEVGVEAAQGSVAEAEEAVARLAERLAQVRGIRARLRALLATTEARYRRSCSMLADAGALSLGGGEEGTADMVQVAGAALARAREQLQGPLGPNYLTIGSPGGSVNGGGSGAGGLARDEEIISEARGFVVALESLATG